MKIFHSVVAAAALLSAVLLTGCASPAQPKAMTVNTISYTAAPHDPVFVQVTGGHKTNPMWTSQISGEDFQTALVESLRKSGIFQSVQADTNAPYKLEVRLDSLDQPTFGFDLTVSMRSDWTLSKSPDGSVLWHQPIFSTYTATMGDAFAGIKRMRLANEGAARRNIEQGLTQLSTLKLNP